MAYKQFSTAMAKWHLHALKSNAHLTNSLVKCMSSSAANQSLNVGFIGLGNMGARMVNNLVKKVIHFEICLIERANTQKTTLIMIPKIAALANVIDFAYFSLALSLSLFFYRIHMDR